MIKVSAPGKLMLFGEHAVVHNRPCIVTSADHRISLSVEKRKDKKIIIRAPDLLLKDYVLSHGEKSYPKEVSFILIAIENFFGKYQSKSGLNIKTKSEFSEKVGLGSSSAVTVATIKALSQIFDVSIKEKEIFDLSYKTVLDVQGIGSGFDVAVATYGGVLYFVTGGKTIQQIDVKNISLIVGYTGIKADTPTLVKMVNKKLLKEPERINNIFDEIEGIVDLARSELENQNWKEVGKLMNKNQELLRQLGVSSKELENLITSALDVGAYGAKLSGAGGGDCMIAIAKEGNEDNIKRAIQKSGGIIIETKIPAEGVRVE
jgi:mevalonate kinase